MKRIYLLIGPKGSGKTYIGTLLDRQAGVPFLRVEDIALHVRQDRAYNDHTYVQDVFRAIENQIRQRLETTDELVFESTGLTDAFDRMLENLQKDFWVVLIRIVTGPETCVRRVKHRDQSLHVDVSDDHVRAINAQAVTKAFAFAGEIRNDEASPDQILTAFAHIRSTRPDLV